MTTTAFDDQYLAAPDPVREPMSREAILRRNITDMEVALKQQTERAEKTEEKLTTDREDMQSWIDSRNGWMERAGAAEAELAKMRKLPNAKMNAPSSPTDEQIHAAYRNALGQSIRERDMPEIRKFSRALLQSSPQAPAVPATCNDNLQVELRDTLQWMIGQRGKSGHAHRVAGVWDGDNGVKAGKTCETCAMYDKARALLQSAEVRYD